MRKLISMYRSRASIEPSEIRLIVTMVRIETTPSRQQRIETTFFLFDCLSSTQKKKPTIGITRKMKFSGIIVLIAEYSDEDKPMSFPAPNALSISKTEFE